MPPRKVLTFIPEKKHDILKKRKGNISSVVYIFMLSVCLFSICVFVCGVYLCGGQRRSSCSQSFPSTMEVSEVNSDGQVWWQTPLSAESVHLHFFLSRH